MTLRAPLAVLNELSFPKQEDRTTKAVATSLLANLVELLRDAEAIRPDLALVSALPLGAAPILATGESFPTIAAQVGGRAREHWRYIQSRRNIAPFSAAPDLDKLDLDEDYLYEGESSSGLGLALASGQLAVSLATRPNWDSDTVQITYVRLVEDADDDIKEERRVETVRHASTRVHVETHRAFISDLALPEPFSGEDLWADRTNRYPHLRFLSQVQGQICGLGKGSATLRQVHESLSKLDQAIRRWDRSTSPSPVWPSQVTSESQSRMHFCRFIDVDGVERYFDLHARFTPGPGRIHFRLDTSSAKPVLAIAYVGRKLGT
jgi:hypothetical protein